MNRNGYSNGSLAFFLRDWRSEPSNLLKKVVVVKSDTIADSLMRDLNYFFRFRSNANEPKTQIIKYNEWDHSAYRNILPGRNSRLERIRALKQIQSQPQWILVCTVSGLLQKTISRSFLNQSFSLKKHQTYNPDQLRLKLLNFGYQESPSVEDKGTFSQRGGIFDVFSPSSSHPTRLEYSDDQIDSIRSFNRETQRSLKLFTESDEEIIIPAREFSCDFQTLTNAKERIKIWCDDHDIPKQNRDRISRMLDQGIAAEELDYMLPFLDPEATSLSDHLPTNYDLTTIEPEEVLDSWESFLTKEGSAYQNALKKHLVVPEPSVLFSSIETLQTKMIQIQSTAVRRLALQAEEPAFQTVPVFHKKGKPEISSLVSFLDENKDKGIHVVFVANAQSQLDRISFLLTPRKFRTLPAKNEADLSFPSPSVFLSLGNISESFLLPQRKICFLSEDDIFGRKSHGNSESEKGASSNVSVSERMGLLLEDLFPGDLVVHIDHGIGRYVGLAKMGINSSIGDYAVLEYADKDKLYLPVYRLELLSKYVSPSATANPLDKLGTGSFAKTKEKVQAAVKDIAAELIRVHAERISKPGYTFSEPNEDFYAMEGEFPFDETPDQAKAIRDTINDMCTGKAMDRLICGDVGFGKTEVAVRAAFKAVQDGKQVAVLVPTTILSEQHLQSFSQRLAPFGVSIASLNRFRSRQEQKEIVAKIAEGKLDIAVGTHRLLSKDVTFQDLGLLVIDEEQRFGVEHKERLKSLKATTDVLTLTATPIPRTLQMSLMGLKDVSVIRTPPNERLSIKTVLSPYDSVLIQTAIQLEIERGGQIYFIHNRIGDIELIKKEIISLVPEARVGIAHGQMGEGALEQVMVDFYQRRIDVLLATAIVENGLDVPNANTLIVNRADTFGLAQLYQIRGRVGRSQTRAYAYFLIPETGLLSAEAKERLSVLQRFVELGSGYSIATHDLEIRGGGDVLGQAQSGHIASIGYEMYLEFIYDEIHRQKEGSDPKKKLENIEINMNTPAYLPETYIPDMRSRLGLYRKASSLSSEEEILDFSKDLEDRFGALPVEAHELLWVIRLKILLRRLGLKALTLGPKGLSIVPGANPTLESAWIVQLIQADPTRYGILPDGRFMIFGGFKTASETHSALRRFLESSVQ